MKITQQKFKDVKKTLFWHTVNQTAAKHDISYKTTAQIKVSKTFEDYTLLNKSQHPEPQYSLADRVNQIHNLVFNQHDNKYLPPRTAREAARELEIKFLKEKK